MAMHRRTVRVASPAELLMLSEGDWVAPDDEASWVAFRRWQDARRAYGKAHWGLFWISCVLSVGCGICGLATCTCESGSRPEIVVCIFA
jgi:hypothetical protein